MAVAHVQTQSSAEQTTSKAVKKINKGAEVMVRSRG